MFYSSKSNILSYKYETLRQVYEYWIIYNLIYSNLLNPDKLSTPNLKQQMYFVRNILFLIVVTFVGGKDPGVLKW